MQSIEGIREEYLEQVITHVLKKSMADAKGDQTVGVALALKRCFVTGFKTGCDKAFTAWLGKLADELVSSYGYTSREATEYVIGQPEAWRDFFNDDYTPIDAAAEDQRAGVE